MFLKMYDFSTLFNRYLNQCNRLNFAENVVCSSTTNVKYFRISMDLMIIILVLRGSIICSRQHIEKY